MVIAPDPSTTEVAADACLNCGAPGARAFCPECGQRHVPAAEASLWTVWGEYAEQGIRELRLPRTIWTLLREPGRLTLEYVAGKRRSQANPLVLLLLLVALQATLNAGVDLAAGLDVAEQILRDSGLDAAQKVRADALLDSGRTWVRDPTVANWILRFVMLWTGLAPGLVVAVAIWALVERDALKAAVFVLHVAVVDRLIGLSTVVAHLLGSDPFSITTGVLGMAVTALTGVYTALAARRSYGLRWPAALVLVLAHFSSGVLALLALMLISGAIALVGGIFVGLILTL